MTPRSAPVEDDWEELFAANPKMLWGLVADVVKAVKAGEGERKTGRRPAVSLRSLDELYEVLFPPAYVTEPFPVAFSHLLTRAGLNQYTYAEASGYSQSTVHRLLTGKKSATTAEMERIAHTLGIRPTYFYEYRALKIGQVITEVLLGNPEMSVDTVRQLATAESR